MMRSMAFVLVALVAGLASAEIPRIISYQGRVTDGSGNPVPDTAYAMRFRIYDAATSGTMLWDSGDQSVAVSGGIFSVLLGESPQPALDLPFDADYWLLVTFDGVNQIPRQRLASAGYAFMAGGLVAGTVIQGSVASTTSGALKAVNTSGSGTRYGGYFMSQSTSGKGVYGEAPHTGIYGKATATTGVNYGGSFASNSSDGRGVHGESPHIGVYGRATATTGEHYGGSFLSNSSAGRAVYGLAAATTGTGYGGYFETASTAGTGVRGVATATTGVTYGVFGRVQSTTADSRGVYGRAMGTSGVTYGVYARSDSYQGVGLYTEAPDYGLIAVSTTNGGTVGKKGIVTEGWMRGIDALARSPDSGWGVRGEGGLAGGFFVDTNSSSTAAVGCSYYKISGTGDVSFVQNHPYQRDRVVVYAAPEGDEVATYTRGTARLVNGVATVALGETFELVTNPDIGLTAHLTPRGDCGGLYVASLSTREMTVRESGGGASDAAFDYLVYGLRIGFEEVGIIQNKTFEAYIPSMHDVRVLYEAHPELRRHNALERFMHMAAAAGIGGSGDLTAARALRDAIEEYDPSVHGPIVPAPVPRPSSREEQGSGPATGIGALQ